MGIYTKILVFNNYIEFLY